MVSRFVLDGFGDPPGRGGRLWTLDKETGRVTPGSSKSATVIPFYYDLPDSAGLAADVVAELADLPPDLPEQDLGRIENAAAPHFKELRDDPGSRPSNEGRAVLALFLATQHIRTPRVREETSAFFTVAYQDHAKVAVTHAALVRDFLARTGGSLRPENVRRFQERAQAGLEHLNISAPLDRQLGVLFAIAQDIAETVFELNWTVRRAEEGAAFVIGDTPVTMFDLARGGRGNAWASSPQAQSVMPLGARAALVMRPGNADDFTHAPARQRLVESMNLRALAWADRYVYGESAEVLRALADLARAHPDRLARCAPVSPRYHLLNEFEGQRADTARTVRPQRPGRS
ncbi:MAG: DUF4238 domain-containing protein [Solirubrobacteraceae bacterium]